MSNKEYIRIGKPRIVNSKTVVFDLAYSKRVKSEFVSDRLYVEYDKNIDELDSGILNIPAVSAVITVAWAVGADVYVEELDKTYLESLAKIKPVFARWYPDFSFSTEIEVENIVSNSFHNDQIGLLFTQGVDSFASYIKNRDKKPHLIKIWGTEVRDDDPDSWKSVRKMLNEFSQKEHVTIHEVRSNIPRVFDKPELYREFGLDWWQNVCHSIVLTGLSAPLTCAEDIGTLLIASSGSEEIRVPWGSDPRIDNKISWADVKVVHDGFETDRQLKIRHFLKDHIRNNGYVPLKVCNDTRLPASNCGRCEKCLRTITGLVAEGIDPNRCGFKNVDRKTFDHLREAFVKKRFLARKWFTNTRSDLFEKTNLLHWQEIQRHSQEIARTGKGLCGSGEFFEWFSRFDLAAYSQQVQDRVNLSLPHIIYMFALSVCDRLPHRIQNQARGVLELLTDRYVPVGK